MTYLIYFGQHADLWSMQHPQRQANHLQILGASSGGDIPWLRPNIEGDGLLQPWDQEVSSFVLDLI